MIELGELAPDLSPIGLGPRLLRAVNVQPTALLAGGGTEYTPAKSLTAMAFGSLNVYCRGAASGRRRGDGTTYTVAGTATRQYVANSAGTLTNRTGFANALGTTSMWSFCQYGNSLIAASIENPLTVHDLSGTANFSTLAAVAAAPPEPSSYAPNAKYVTVIGDFVFAGNIVGNVDNAAATGRDCVHWCAFDNPAKWPPVGSAAAKAVQSDYQPLAGYGGDVQGMTGGREYGLILQERAVHRADYSGGSDFFRFTPIDRRRGAFIPGSIIQVGAVTFYYSEEGWMACNGSGVEPIGYGRIDKTFAADLDESYLHRMTVGAFPDRPIIRWFYPGAGNSSGTPNKGLDYNYVLNRWSQVEGIELEALVTTTQVGANVDTPISADIDGTPFDVDASTASGIRASLGAFTTAHTLAAFTGSAMSGTLETGDFELVPGRTAYVRGVRPIQSGSGLCVVGISARNAPASASPAYGYDAPNASQGMSGKRSRGRYHRALLYTLTDCGALSGLDADVTAMGGR